MEGLAFLGICFLLLFNLPRTFGRTGHLFLLSCTAKAMLSKMPMRRWDEFKNWQQCFVIDATQGQLKTNQTQICVILDCWVKQPKLQTSYLSYEVPCATGGKLPNFQYMCKGSLSSANTCGCCPFLRWKSGFAKSPNQLLKFRLLGSFVIFWVCIYMSGSTRHLLRFRIWRILEVYRVVSCECLILCAMALFCLVALAQPQPCCQTNTYNRHVCLCRASLPKTRVQKVLASLLDNLAAARKKKGSRSCWDEILCENKWEGGRIPWLCFLERLVNSRQLKGLPVYPSFSFPAI